MPGGAALAAVVPAPTAAEQIAFVECCLCKRLLPKDTCIDTDRAGVGNRKPRFKCKTCNSFAKSLSTTLAGHVELREQWGEKTAEQRAAWIDEQRLALQSFGTSVVVKELTQCLSITQEESETTEEREQFGVERDWLDAKDVTEKYKDKPGVAKQVFDNCPPVSQSGIVFGCRACFRVLGVCCC